MIKLKSKDHVQPSQDNRDDMVKKLEKGSNLTTSAPQQVNLKGKVLYKSRSQTWDKRGPHVPWNPRTRQSLQERKSNVQEQGRASNAKKKVILLQHVPF